MEGIGLDNMLGAEEVERMFSDTPAQEPETPEEKPGDETPDDNKNIETEEVFKKSGVSIWECRNCGHIVVGTSAPDVCPVCNHPQSYFEVTAQNY